MKRSELRVKVASLVSERGIILNEMHRVDRIGDRHAPGSARHEALRQTWQSLHTHRRKLASEVRSALLATAFLRGRPYAEVEWFALTDPDLVRVRKIAEAFGLPFGSIADGLIAPKPYEREITAKWIEWRDAAVAHVATFPALRTMRISMRAEGRARRAAASVAPSPDGVLLDDPLSDPRLRRVIVTSGSDPDPLGLADVPGLCDPLDPLGLAEYR